MRKLLIYIRDYKLESILGPLFKLLEACMDLIVPLVMAYIIDKGIGGNDKGLIIRLCLVLVGLGFVGLTFSITAQFFAAKASVGFIKQVKHAVFSHIQKLSFSDIDRLGTNTLITRLTSDMNQIQTGVNLTLRLFLRSPFIVLGAVVMAFTIDTQIAVIFVITIIVLSAVVFGVMHWCIPRYKEVQSALDKVLGKTRENLTGVRVIRAFCKEDEEIKNFEASNAFLTGISKKVGMVSSLMNPLTYVIINIGIAALIYKGAIRVEDGALTKGQIVALYNYMSQILIELVKFANMFLNITRSIACGNRVQSILEIEPGMEEGTDVFVKAEDENADSIVEFKNVSLNYNGKASADKEENALNNISFTVKKGETVAFVGNSGGGKSTLVNLIPRFFDVAGGVIKIDGIDIRDYEIKSLRKAIGIVPQETFLFAGTILSNIKYSRQDATFEEIVEAAKQANAHEFIENLSDGYDTEIGERGVKLSGGQKQRIAIARAILENPQILILDEATSALDNESEKLVQEALEKLMKGKTTFVIAHRLTTIENSNKIVVIQKGEIKEIGNHNELLSKNGIYKALYNKNFDISKKN